MGLGRLQDFDEGTAGKLVKSDGAVASSSIDITQARDSSMTGADLLFSLGLAIRHDAHQIVHSFE